MIDFTFVSPTKIYFGHGAEMRLPEALQQFRHCKVVLLYGQGSIKKSGLYDRVIACLKEAGVSYLEFSGIRPNPQISFVRAILPQVREFAPDLILAVGGGSVIDTAKSLAVSFSYPGDPFDFNRKISTPTSALKVGVILTIASAGSELSDSCVMSDDTSNIKQGFNHDLVRPEFVLENPELTFTVSPYQTAAGVSDIMMHSLERYFGGVSDDNQLSDAWALDLVKNTMIAGERALTNPRDYQARAELMLNSSLSHNGLTGLGKKCPFSVHPLEHAVSGYRPDITHGAGVALIYPAWAMHVLDKAVDKFAMLTKVCFPNKIGANKRETAIIGVQSMKEFFHRIGMPTSFQEVGIQENDLPHLVSLATGNGTRVIGLSPQSLEKKDVEQIYRSLLD